MIFISNSIFEDHTSNNLGGLITNLVDEIITIEISTFYNVLTTSTANPYCAGAIYKSNGNLIMKRVCFDYCATIISGANTGGSVLVGVNSFNNITMCCLTHSSYKNPAQSPDAPLYFDSTKKDFIAFSNLSNCNGNDNYGNVFMEIKWNDGSETAFTNFVNGTAMLFEQYYQPKKENTIRRCNIVRIKVEYLIAGDTKEINIIESAFFENSKGTIVPFAKFDNCWSDDDRICSPVVKFTHIPNGVSTINC